MIRISVNGTPEPGGSKRAFMHRGLVSKHKIVREDGKWWVPADKLQSMIVLLDANKNVKKWKRQVAAAAEASLPEAGFSVFDEPVIMLTTFYRRRPRGHIGKRGLTKKGRDNPWPATKPDTTKLLRGTEDALSGIVFRDDSLVVSHWTAKEWAEESEPEGAEIVVVPADDYSIELTLNRIDPANKRRDG